MPGSGYRRPPALVRRADGQVVTLTPLLHQVMAAVDGPSTVEEVAERVTASSGRLVRPEDVRQLVGTTLRPLGLLRRADGGEPELRRSDPLLALKFRRVVTDPAVTERLTAPFAVLFSPLVVVPVVLAFGAVAAWVLFDQGLAAATAQAFAHPALFLAVVAVTVLSAGFHEFGHAAAARYGGSTPGAMGFGIYLFWPAFYTDVTDSYRLGRAGRVRTDLGGLYFNALVVLASFGVWWATGWHAVLLIVATQVLQMIRQLAPLLRFDGYHVLADLTGVPDLYQRMGPVMSGLLPGRWRQPEATALKTWARVVVVVWVLLVVPLMAVSLLLMVLALPRLLATAWAALGRQATLLADAFDGGDVLGVLARLLGIVAIAVPVLGIGYVLARTLRQVVGGVRRRTEGRPVRRALALVLAATVVAGLVWAWWPADDRYRPVRAWEGGTVLDAVPASAGQDLAAGARRGRPRPSGPPTPGRCPRPSSRRWPSSSCPAATARAAATRTAAAGTEARRADLGLPVRPPAAARGGGQPGARGEHRGRLGALRRLLRPRLGRRRRGAQPQRGLRAGQLPRLHHGRRRLPGRPARGFRRRRRPAEHRGGGQLRVRRVRHPGAGDAAGAHPPRPAQRRRAGGARRDLGGAAGVRRPHRGAAAHRDPGAAHRVRAAHPRRRPGGPGGDGRPEPAAATPGGTAGPEAGRAAGGTAIPRPGRPRRPARPAPRPRPRRRSRPARARRRPASAERDLRARRDEPRRPRSRPRRNGDAGPADPGEERAGRPHARMTAFRRRPLEAPCPTRPQPVPCATPTCSASTATTTSPPPPEASSWSAG